MNPLWVLVGIEVGDRLRAGLRDGQVIEKAGRVWGFVREAAEDQIAAQKIVTAIYRIDQELPTTEERGVM